MTPEIKEMKQRFALQLKKCLETRYGGRVPSISTIARDFSLQSNHLPHVSGETVRKWLRAETIPQYPRVQCLSDWLGPELLLPFEHWQPKCVNPKRSENHHITSDETIRLMSMIQQLALDDFDLLYRLADKLHSKKTK